MVAAVASWATGSMGPLLCPLARHPSAVARLCLAPSALVLPTQPQGRAWIQPLSYLILSWLSSPFSQFLFSPSYLHFSPGYLTPYEWQLLPLCDLAQNKTQFGGILGLQKETSSFALALLSYHSHPLPSLLQPMGNCNPVVENWWGSISPSIIIIQYKSNCFHTVHNWHFELFWPLIPDDKLSFFFKASLNFLQLVPLSSPVSWFVKVNYSSKHCCLESLLLLHIPRALLAQLVQGLFYCLKGQKRRKVTERAERYG